MCCHRDSNSGSPACNTGMLTTKPQQLTLHNISPSSQELNTAPPTGLITCLLLTLSIHPQISYQSHCALTNHYHTDNKADIGCKSLLLLVFEPWLSRLQDTHANHYTLADYTTQHVNGWSCTITLPVNGMTPCYSDLLTAHFNHYPIAQEFTF